MKRRDFLKLLSISPISPSVLAAMPELHLTLAMSRMRKSKKELDGDHLYNPTRIWAEEMARLHNEAMDEMIIDCLG